MTSLAQSLGIARKVGEGYDRPNAEYEVPIDINYARLAEWLVDRKQVPADWNRKLQALQAKAAEALKELPPGFLGQFEGGEDLPLDYLRAKEILAKLASEGAEKSFLGSYKGAAGVWDKITRAYEYNLLHVAEAALALGRNADYEIPFLRKQAAKAQQQLGDLERRQAEALRSAAAAAADFQQECAELGVDGRDIRGGLLGLTAELPPLMGAAVEALRADAVGQALEHYAVFAAHSAPETKGGDGTAAAAAGGGTAMAGEDQGPGLLPTLEEVLEGRTEAPQAPSGTNGSGAPAAGAAGGASGAAAAAGIDWGLDADAGAAAAAGAGAASEPGGGISWDLDVSAGDRGEAAAGGGGGISWDLGDLAAALEAGAEGQQDDEGAGEAGAALIDITWDIDLTTAGEEAGELLLAEQQQAGAGAGGSGTAAHAAAAGGGLPEFGDAPRVVQRLIEDHAYRARLLDDLSELRAFLTQRCLEQSSKGNELLASSLPEAVQHVGADALAAMKDAVAAAIAALTGDRLQQLLLLRSSPRHVDRQAQALAHRGGQEAKFKRAAREAEARRGEVQRQLMADSAKLAVLTKRTRELKDMVEEGLGAKLGRRINIMGEINNLI